MKKIRRKIIVIVPSVKPSLEVTEEILVRGLHELQNEGKLESFLENPFKVPSKAFCYADILHSPDFSQREKVL